MTLKPGDKFAGFDILEFIGGGAFGQVYRARDHKLKRDIALKLVKVQGMYFSEEGVGRFKAEAEILGRLNHSNIIRIYDTGVENGIPWMSMPLMAGSLAKRLENGPPPREQTERILETLAGALDYAHREKITHRDIKPQNVLFDEHGAVYLADFGLAFVEDETHWPARSGVVVGTPPYMAPEQIRATGVDTRSDIFGFGVLTFELFFRYLPFGRDLRLPRAMPQLVSDKIMPERAFRVILKCFAEDKNDRWPTASEFVRALTRALREAPIAHEQPEPESLSRWETLLEARLREKAKLAARWWASTIQKFVRVIFVALGIAAFLLSIDLLIPAVSGWPFFRDRKLPIAESAAVIGFVFLVFKIRAQRLLDQQKRYLHKHLVMLHGWNTTRTPSTDQFKIVIRSMLKGSLQECMKAKLSLGKKLGDCTAVLFVADPNERKFLPIDVFGGDPEYQQLALKIEPPFLNFDKFRHQYLLAGNEARTSASQRLRQFRKATSKFASTAGLIYSIEKGLVFRQPFKRCLTFDFSFLSDIHPSVRDRYSFQDAVHILVKSRGKKLGVVHFLSPHKHVFNANDTIHETIGILLGDALQIAADMEHLEKRYLSAIRAAEYLTPWTQREEILAFVRSANHRFSYDNYLLRLARRLLN